MLNNTESTPSYNDVQKSFVAIVMTSISIISIIGNLMVFVAYLKVKSLQRATNYFILSLATADFVVALVIVNVYTMYMLIGWPSLVLPYGVCVIWLCVDYWMFQVSVFGVLLITGDR